VSGLGAWLAAVIGREARGEAALAIVGDATMRRLNREFRGVDRVTDVLSFPTPDSRFPSPGSSFLGDIVIARGRAAAQARDAGHSLGTELRVLALHGLLHLLGYDHESDDGEMARKERRLRRQGGLDVGLIEPGALR
jgi:probable rRNA maturation factor